MLVGILILSPAISSLMDTHELIRSTGIIAHVANSGSVEDIQEAVDEAVVAGGGVVLIPEGTFLFDAYDTRRVSITVPAGGLTIFGAGINRTVLQMPIDDSAPDTMMFKVNGLSGGKFRISGITFRGRRIGNQVSLTGDIGIKIESCQDFRVDHCSFHDLGAQAVNVYDCDQTYGHSGGDISLVSQGVVDHCDFIDVYKPGGYEAPDWRCSGYGVFVARAYHYWWTVPNLYPDDPWTMFGKYYKNVFIEDCYFLGCRHAVVGNFAGAYVLRNSVIEDIWAPGESATTGHPVRYKVLGMLVQEIYNVTVKNRGTRAHFIGFHVEGGSALIFNCTLDSLDYGFSIGSCEWADTDDNPFLPLGATKEVYIWNNNIINIPPGAVVWIFSNEPNGYPAPGENVDYFLHGPPAEKDYQPYPYPHPLTGD
jgi:hypothetical protein